MDRRAQPESPCLLPVYALVEQDAVLFGNTERAILETEHSTSHAVELRCQIDGRIAIRTR